ncbi:MAG: AAA family ATPase, partial [Hyphomicrobiaceae bacterium]
MQIAKLRLIGFKSFVEPVDLSIEPGLTGVVGPNGCGKSNLLEALRWVMGESSYKSMRAAAMDDVIFSGTNSRPPRNMAEVTIFIDNTDRQAPAEFNQTEQIEVTRRIEREAGSVYRINGREVRARDVKILFEDAATGARSPALVRQGQIGEIVNAKPEQRRRILEDAAGIAGLHSRRHEAELRLKAAENNLTRIGDVTGQLKNQIDGLKRQARQAKRYTQLSDEIRRNDALVHYLMWLDAQVHVDHDEAALQLALESFSVATQFEAEAVKREHSSAETIKPLREAEVATAATVARLTNEQTSLDQELDRVVEREKEMAAQVAQLSSDLQRETGLVAEAKAVLAEQAHGLKETDAELAQLEAGRPEAATLLDTADCALKTAEQNLAKAMAEQTRWKSDRRAAEAQVEERSS